MALADKVARLSDEALTLHNVHRANIRSAFALAQADLINSELDTSDLEFLDRVDGYINELISRFFNSRHEEFIADEKYKRDNSELHTDRQAPTTSPRPESLVGEVPSAAIVRLFDPSPLLQINDKGEAEAQPTITRAYESALDINPNNPVLKRMREYGVLDDMPLSVTDFTHQTSRTPVLDRVGTANPPTIREVVHEATRLNESAARTPGLGASMFADIPALPSTQPAEDDPHRLFNEMVADDDIPREPPLATNPDFAAFGGEFWNRAR